MAVLGPRVRDARAAIRTTSRPSADAAARTAAASAWDRAGRATATSVPPVRSSGAAYSATTAGASERPGDDGIAARRCPRATPRRGHGRPRRSWRRSAAATRGDEVALCATRSRRDSPGRPGGRSPSGSPGNPAPEPRSAIVTRSGPRAARAPTSESARWSSTIPAGSRTVVGAWGSSASSSTSTRSWSAASAGRP